MQGHNNFSVDILDDDKLHHHFQTESQKLSYQNICNLLKAWEMYVWMSIKITVGYYYVYNSRLDSNITNWLDDVLSDINREIDPYIRNLVSDILFNEYLPDYYPSMIADNFGVYLLPLTDIIEDVSLPSIVKLIVQ